MPQKFHLGADLDAWTSRRSDRNGNPDSTDGGAKWLPQELIYEEGGDARIKYGNPTCATIGAAVGSRRSLVADWWRAASTAAGHGMPRRWIWRCQSLVPIFHGQQRQGHELLAWNCGRGRAILMNKWKLVHSHDGRPWELYNLENDIGETDNLAADFPEHVRTMAAKYETWRRRVGAR